MIDCVDSCLMKSTLAREIKLIVMKFPFVPSPSLSSKHVVPLFPVCLVPASRPGGSWLSDLFNIL